jgi:hypothetical protein
MPELLEIGNHCASLPVLDDRKTVWLAFVERKATGVVMTRTVSRADDR